MNQEVSINTPITFLPHRDLGRIEVRKALLEEADGRWSACRLILETDVETARRLEHYGFFHNTPENRLEEVERGFHEDLPVLLELALRPSKLALLPTPSEDVDQRLIALLAAEPPLAAELFHEDSWNALLVWQEHHLDPSIGGGVIKVGYRTVFSPPRNEIDRLKRRGRVSRTVVEALIENGLPVRFEPERQAFEVGLAVGEHTYTCRIRPHDGTIALSLTVVWSREIPEEAVPRVRELLGQINDEITLGYFEAGDGRLRYLHHIQVAEALVNQSWVIETLRAGVSMIHHYVPRVLAAVEGNAET
jgi:hypothetical protein